MKIKNVNDPSFKKYGSVLEGYDPTDLLKMLDTQTPCPPDAVVYVPSVAQMEALPVSSQLSSNCYGGMPIQVGYCNGHNRKLNCLEYHRDSEVDIPSTDCILLLASKADIVDGMIDTARVEAFFAPKGTVVQLYETTLHYAPCSSKPGTNFRVVIVLPKGTNTDKPQIVEHSLEDSLLWARNKWLLAHKDSSEAAQGAHVGLTGENICLG